MNHQNLIAFLLENANPSSRLRVKKEVLGRITAEEEADLIAQIKEEPIYKLIASCQKENGWLGSGFHGPNKDAGPYENQEVGTKWLAEKAVGKDDPVLKRAMDAFVTTELTDLCYRTKGKYFDEFRYAANGQNLIRSACIARAGMTISLISDRRYSWHLTPLSVCLKWIRSWISHASKRSAAKKSAFSTITKNGLAISALILSSRW